MVLQDLDGNTGKNVEAGNNNDTCDIQSISEAACLAWDEPILGKYVDMSEKLKKKKTL